MPLFTIIEKLTQHKHSQKNSVPHQWQQQRKIFLAIAFFGILLALVRIGFGSPPGKRSLSAFTFPSTVPLSEWQLIDSRTLEQVTKTQSTYDTVIASQKYLYRKQGQILTIEMRYMPSNVGDLEDYLHRYSKLKLEPGQRLQTRRDRQGIGFYSLFTYGGRSHLATCLNPQGGSTVTKEQFLANRYNLDLQPQRILSWLFSNNNLLEKRCLWVDLSLPLQQSTDSTYQILEQTWQPWARWWLAHFPKP